MTDPQPKPEPLVSALVTVFLLIGLLGLAVFLFGDDAIAGPNQLAIAVCAAGRRDLRYRPCRPVDMVEGCRAKRA